MADAFIPAEMFIQLYMESYSAGHTVRQFAERVGLTSGNVRGRIYHYRKRGVRLPSLKSAIGPRQRPRLNVGEINRKIEQYVSQSNGRALPAGSPTW
jgi:hypothetical protein